ncbi:MAG: amino acid permease [Flavobacteriales bacterium]|nr:MAG: amino acid permease [Flavobacteriales bacterium]
MKKLVLYQLLNLGLLIQLLLIHLLARHPQTVEKYYSNFFYIGISKFLRFIFGWIPFSVGDVLIAILIGMAIYKLIKIIRQKPKISLYGLFKYMAILSVIYFIFNIMWGLNYYRQSFEDKLGLTKDSITIFDLELLANKMIDRTKSIQLELVENDSIPVNIPYNHSHIARFTTEAYKQNRFKNYRDILTRVSSKKSLFSLPLSYMGFAGYLNPITGEAQLNSKIPNVIQPAVSCHETAHQLGIASEDEASFLGFMVAAHSDNLYFKYSAYFYALQRVLQAIYLRDEAKFEAIAATLPKGIKKDMANVKSFWQSYKNPTRPVFNVIYDTFLKANRQKEGLKSYSKVVDLLVAYNQKYEGI